MLAGGSSTVIESPGGCSRGPGHRGASRTANRRADHRCRRRPARVGAVARNQAIQTLADMIIRVPKPELTPPGSSQADAVVYAVTKRSVSEGQMVREGEAVCELIIENPLRLWTSAPERCAERVRVGQPVRIAAASQPELTFEGKVVRINPSVDPSAGRFRSRPRFPTTGACCGPAASPRRRSSPNRQPRQMTDGRWRMADGEWQMAEPKSRIANTWAGE